MPVNREEMLAELPAQVKAVNDALVEVCKVLTTSNAPGAKVFDVAKVWGENAENDIRAYVVDLSINPDITSAVTTIKGNSAGSAVMNGINTVIGGLSSVISQIVSTANAVADPGVMAAFQQLTQAHDENQYGQAPFGLIPGIAGIITAAGGDANALTGALDEIGEAANIVQAMSAFANFADGTLALLQKALNPA
ncbi:MAG: hypothetical protein K0R39_3391 [Symbiobacteriaceae bacterium]|jgi:hypothetical protein|nr:hypothetical protein [Symbiobacteriaceae bacterium]